MRRRKLVIAGIVGVLLLLGTLASPPCAEINILTHNPADMAPRQFHAVVDIGLFAISLLITWTAEES